jgi:hypothetical protein
LILHEMPVEDIELMQGEEIEEFLDLGDGEKMAGYVEHRAPPGEARLVLDQQARYFLGRLGTEELAQSLATVEKSAQSLTGDHDALRSDFEGVSLWSGGELGVETEDDVTFDYRFADDVDLVQRLDDCLGQRLQSRVCAYEPEEEDRGDRESACRAEKRSGLRYEVHKTE